MEACGSAHYWARQLQAHGYVVKLVAPQFVKPYIKSNKNDANDAEAICEAMCRPNMRFVAVKTVEQQDIQAVYRIRAALLSQRPCAWIRQVHAALGSALQAHGILITCTSLLGFVRVKLGRIAGGQDVGQIVAQRGRRTCCIVGDNIVQAHPVLLGHGIASLG